MKKLVLLVFAFALISATTINAQTPQTKEVKKETTQVDKKHCEGKDVQKPACCKDGKKAECKDKDGNKKECCKDAKKKECNKDGEKHACCKDKQKHECKSKDGKKHDCSKDRAAEVKK